MAADVSIRIGADLAEIKGALASLRKDMGSVGQAAQRAGSQQAFTGIESGARGALASVGRLVAGFATLASAIALIGQADELNTLNARLKLVTGSTEEFARAQVALFDMAQRTRSSLKSTIDLYARIAQSTKDAGVGQETLLSVVETINQAVQLSGASAQAADAALVQLGQGLGSGTLLGQELNSVLEQTPALADAIAKGVGITRGELRKFGEEGKITSQAVITALLKQRDVVAQQFAELPLTVGQSVTLLKNAGLQLVGAADTSSKATQGLAKSIKEVADFLGSDEVLGIAVEFATLWGDAFRQFADDAAEAVRIVNQALGTVESQSAETNRRIARDFLELPVHVRTFARVVAVEVASLFDKIIAYGTFVRENIAAIFTADTQDEAWARFQQRLEGIRTAAREVNEETFAARDKALADAANQRAATLETRRLARRNPGSSSLGTFKRTQTDEEKRKADQLRKAQLDSEERLTKDSYQRQIGIVQEFYEDGKFAAADYFARRQALELEAADRAIALERRKLAGADPAERTKILADIELLERQKGDVQRRIQREQAAEARRLAAELAQAQAQDLENQGRGAEAARIRAEASFGALLARLEAESNAAGVRLVRGLIDASVAKAQFDELRAQAERFIADLERQRADIERRVSSGQITPAQGRQEGDAAQVDAAARLAPVNAQLQALATTIKDPQIVQAAVQIGDAIARIGDRPVAGVRGAIIDLQRSLDDMSQSLAKTAVNSGVDALSQFFTDIATGSKSAGDALKDFVRGFVASMAQIAARAIATTIILTALSAYTGIPPSTLAAFAGVGAAPYHEGGMVSAGGGGQKRQLPAWVFASAPRFHGGGMVGLKADEVPAVLQTGERVLNRQETAAYNSGGSGGGVRILNVIDPNLVQDYMTSAAGERAVLNIIERNRGAVRQKLA